MKDFDNNFLIIGKSNLLSENLHTILKETEMFSNEYIKRMHEDILSVVAMMYFDGDKKQALKVLDVRKEITHGQLMRLSLFSGATLSQLFMILVFFYVVGQNVDSVRTRWFIDEFF